MSRKRLAGRMVAASALTLLAACGDGGHTAAPASSTTPPVSSESSLVPSTGPTVRGHLVPPSTVTVPGAFGTIVGRIDACSGLSSDRTVAGIVTVTKGVKSTNHTTGQAVVLPGVRVSTQKVPAAGQFRFEVPAGPYVLESVRSDPDPTGPYEYVRTVAVAGRTVRADIPNDCL